MSPSHRVYNRRYEHNAPTAVASRRHFQVGESVWFHFPYNRTPVPKRAATVISHDTYHVEELSAAGYIYKDAFYTVKFDGTDTTRSWVRAAWLKLR